MIETARSKRSPVFGMDETLNEVVGGNKRGTDFGIHRAYKKINLLADPLGEKSSEALPQTVHIGLWVCDASSWGLGLAIYSSQAFISQWRTSEAKAGAERSQFSQREALRYSNKNSFVLS